jgi:hypothetical protein
MGSQMFVEIKVCCFNTFQITPLVSTKISYLHINFFTFAKSFFFHILNYRVDQSIFCFFQIVHKRLAARNILLDFLLEPKSFFIAKRTRAKGQ